MIQAERTIPFNKPYLTGKELVYIRQAHEQMQLAGDGEFTNRCSRWLEKKTGCMRALLTHSCTAALEMAAILTNIKPGDEVIIPSYTFVSTANAFVNRGAIPVFVDIRPDTLNLDERLIEAAITPRTRAIVPVHYAGVPCEMDAIMELASRYGLLVIEDAAQGVLSNYKGRPLGSIGDMGCYSFHETKNITSGEGGALLINNPSMVERAEIIREKGTNRSKFFRGQVDKYTWVDIGSSYLPGEIIAAFLWAQLEDADLITARRLELWRRYHEVLGEIEGTAKTRGQTVLDSSGYNGHLYYLLLGSPADRTSFIETMRAHGISTVFHYIPLHSSPLGKRVGRTVGDLAVTTDVADRLVRLPMWVGLEECQEEVIGRVCAILDEGTRPV